MSSPNRYRLTDERKVGTTRVTDYNPGGGLGSDSVNSNIGRMAHGFYKSIADVASSRQEYQAAIKSGGVINHPMNLRSEIRTSDASNWYFGEHPVWGARRISGDIACLYHEGPSGSEWLQYSTFVDEDFDRALIEAYAKVNSPDALSRVIWLEREKTVRFVGNAVERAAFAIEGRIPDLENRMRASFSLSKGAGAVSTFTKWWNGIRFGVRPMIADISDVAKAAAHKRPYTGKLLIARGGVKREFNHSNVTLAPGLGGSNITRVGQWQETANTSAGIFYQLKDASALAWKAHCLGLSADSTPRDTWEAMPYSWAVDYFYKVGNWINASTPNPFVEIIDDWVTQVRKQVNSTTITKAEITVVVSPTTTYTASGGKYLEHLDTVVRRTGSGVPSAPVSSGKPLTFAQAVDLASVALQHFSGVTKRIDGIIRRYS